ncbi:MAG: NADH-quinone oxidoreductase subunit NuoE [Candidatus Bipolaricaulota bacterium]|nr:NADH-quinone oxidoreductase subunit NuoE [Candidatus Bipolaricaulota bacterium]MCX7844750.1 NADH-quinone oxidoreductase subunit NuoE [Candidatus Bipolaricaulota bacterium]MDW8151813.1 NADH-quinone oxidoreductase subunit NuoE [Candidatus Bipolaricaulota bacterium]
MAGQTSLAAGRWSRGFRRFPRRESSVIPLLQLVQEQEGYIPPEAVRAIARYAGVPEAQVYGVATFYAQFRFQPRGRHVIRLCQGTACHVQGADALLEHLKERLGVEEGGTTADGLFTLEVVRCLGCCSLAPVMMVDEATYGRLTRRTVDQVLAQYRKEGR